MSSTTTSMYLPPYWSNSSWRDNQSLPSSSSSSCSVHPNVHPAAESAIACLLVAIRQLLESLTQWSQRKMNEDQRSSNPDLLRGEHACIHRPATSHGNLCGGKSGRAL
ncbi:hypothetical protein M405DRAFT_26832 [Rhizopogon salebrosus TDB-379]|nr:hypothetical protein M405DRAFT_26832 [Rhizopogon salebrosus TDB-379]